MKLKVAGKDYKIDLARFDKISDGIYLLRVEFSEPKYFECLAGVGSENNKIVYSIDIFPKDRKGMIDMTLIPDKEFKPGEEYRIFCESSRYILDAIFVRKDLLEKELREISVISLNI